MAFLYCQLEFRHFLLQHEAQQVLRKRVMRAVGRINNQHRSAERSFSYLTGLLEQNQRCQDVPRYGSAQPCRCPSFTVCCIILSQSINVTDRKDGRTSCSQHIRTCKTLHSSNFKITVIFWSSVYRAEAQRACCGELLCNSRKSDRQLVVSC